MTHAAQFINDLWSAGEGAEFSSVNPAKNEVIWTANSASEQQVDKAVKSARNAFFAWSDLVQCNPKRHGRSLIRSC